MIIDSYIYIYHYVYHLAFLSVISFLASVLCFIDPMLNKNF